MPADTALAKTLEGRLLEAAKGELDEALQVA